MEDNISHSHVNFKTIDWMRGLAALYVVIQHARGYLYVDSASYEKYVLPKVQWRWQDWVNTLIIQHTNLGKEFVVVFFVLSGFCIMHSISTEYGGLRGFFERRLIRLYPVYVLGLIWAIVVFLIVRAFTPTVFYSIVEGRMPMEDAFDGFINLKAIALNLFYFINNDTLITQYWSLPLEIIFYLSIPFFVRNFRNYTIFSLLAFVVGLIWSGFDYMDSARYPLILRYILDYNLYFYIGCVFYKYRNFLTGLFKMDRMRSMISLGLIFIMLVFIKSYLFEQHTNKITGLIIVGFAYIMIISGLKHQIRIKWLEWIGGFSYTLYVTHVATLFIVKMEAYRMGFNFYDIFVMYAWYIGVLVSVLVAFILYFIAEYPTKKYLSKLREIPYTPASWSVKKAY